MRLWSFPLALGALASACTGAREDDAGSTVLPPVSPSASWSREASAPDVPRDARSASLVAPKSADPAALAELLKAVSRKPPPPPTGEDGKTALGDETGVAPTAEAPFERPLQAKKPETPLPTAVARPPMSEFAMERAARAQLHYGLVQRCRDRAGKILPPEAIRLSFSLDADGYIEAPTILATTKDPQFEEAALCIRREVSKSTFRGPPSARGERSTVTLLVPPGE